MDRAEHQLTGTISVTLFMGHSQILFNEHSRDRTKFLIVWLRFRCYRIWESMRRHA